MRFSPQAGFTNAGAFNIEPDDVFLIDEFGFEGLAPYTGRNGHPVELATITPVETLALPGGGLESASGAIAYPLGAAPAGDRLDITVWADYSNSDSLRNEFTLNNGPSISAVEEDGFLSSTLKESFGNMFAQIPIDGVTRVDGFQLNPLTHQFVGPNDQQQAAMDILTLGLPASKAAPLGKSILQKFGAKFDEFTSVAVSSIKDLVAKVVPDKLVSIDDLPIQPTRDIPGWNGSGPQSGILGVNPSSSSTGALQNFTNSEGVEFIFDPTTSTFLVRGQKYQGQHSLLAESIDAPTDQVVGGILTRSDNGAFITN